MTINTTGQPTHSDLLNIAGLCLLILGQTSAPDVAPCWRRERNGARRILKRSKAFGYFHGKDAPWDYDWLVDTLTTIEEEVDPGAVTVTLADIDGLFATVEPAPITVTREELACLFGLGALK